MAIRQVRIGSADNVIQYDDADFAEAIETDQPIKAGTPSDPTDVLRLGDVVSVVLSAAFPVGCVYLTVVSTNPNTLLGFGTWIRIAEGQFLAGFKTGDPDFGVVEATGGNKDHTHNTDIDSTISSTPSATATVQSGTGATVAKDDHTHTVDPASKTSGNNSALPPFFVIYIWKRTA